MRPLPVTLVFVVGIGFVGCGQRPSQRESAPRPATNAVPATADAPVQLDTKMLGWKQGRQYWYRMVMSSQIALGERASLYDFDLTGKVTLFALVVAQETATFYVTVEDVKFVSRVPGSQGQFDQLAAQFNRPYFFEMKGGLVTSANMPRDIHPMVGSVLRTVSASLQFARAQGPLRSFTAKEYDTTGPYVAQYSPLPDKSGWHKLKQKYLGILLAKNQPKPAIEIVPQIVKSWGELRLSDEGRPINVSLRDELILNNAQAPLKSKTAILLEAQTNENESTLAMADWRALRAVTPQVGVDVPFESELEKVDLDDAKIDGMTFQKICNQLERTAATPKPLRSNQDSSSESKPAALKQQDRTESRAFIALGAIFRRQPDTIQQAVAKIQAKTSISDVLLDGLGAADSPQAQHALIRLIENNANDKMLRTRALISLSRTDHPSAEAVDSLRSLLDHQQLGTQALYGLGSYCRLFRKAEKKDLANRLGDILIQRLDAARSELRLIDSLRAIGNSGYAPALAKVKPFITDSREQIRVDAVRALRAMESPDVDRALVERLAADSAKLVRLAAIEAMANRTPTDILVKGLQQAATADDPHVRYRSVEVMIRWLPNRTELRQNIQAVAKNDDETKIRDLAKAAL